ncbi:MAG TPA: antibiotic biosynthesis monooxygenase [Kofleriaceae bacterium]|nr:antibiotic biosynthesis monooxygenase [Kofleriaceae bacterium]
MATPASAQDDSVTIVTTRRVRPGREPEFELWLDGIGQAAARYPGLIGRKIIRPGDHEHPEYVVVFKFDSYPHLRAWTESPERARWLEQVRPLVLDEFKETVLTGLERWFTLPTAPNLPPPPRYKMAAVTLLAIYPLSLALGLAFAPWVAPLPTALRGLPVSVLLIALMTWVVMPRVTRLFKFWLYPQL